MPTKIAPTYIFGGVDSRSNPLNLPRNRSLRAVNWVPREDGHLELSWGYAAVTMNTVTATAIHSIYPFRMLDGTNLLLFWQGTVPKVLNLATGVVTTPTVRGAAVASSNTWSYFLANNRVHGSNGTDSKWFDGTTWRDTGIRALTAAEVASVAVYGGVREMSTTELGAVVLALAAGGSFAAASKGGHAVYVAYFDTSLNELGPATTLIGARQVPTLNQKITLATLPDLSAVNANWVKLLALSADGVANAYFFTNTSTAITSNARASSTLTVTATAHGLSTGDVVILSGTTNFDGMYAITVSDVNTFTLTLASAAGANTAAGTVKRVVSVANATTTGEITSYTVDTSILANEDKGLAATSVGGAQPGFQFYLSIYNPNGGGHVGNRLSVGSRFAPTTRTNVRFSGLPSLAGSDTEWVKLIGRTGDGAEVPYVITDSSGNWTYAANAATTLSTGAVTLDGSLELPSRSGVPIGFVMLCRAADHAYGVATGSRYVYRSGSEQDDLNGDFVGRPEQAWAPNDLETFPTAEEIKCLAAFNQEPWLLSKNDFAVLSTINGVLTWQGPWNMGGAGKRAFTRGWRNLPYWLTHDKQLATMGPDGPLSISDEYEAALLATIGDAYLENTELAYQRIASKGIDRLIIKAQDSTGAPFLVYHDFRLRDERSPFGQAYKRTYLGALATNFTICEVRDSNGAARVYAGGSDGQFYELDSGSTDNAAEFDADIIFLVNFGPERPALPYVEWYGDANVVVSVAKTLDVTVDDPGSTFLPLKTVQVQGGAHDFQYRAELPVQEAKHVYIRLQLTSHSADGSLALNDPPHAPLESYGRVWMVAPAIGQGRGHA